jgi:A/G-specific adenine glycosylase
MRLAGAAAQTKEAAGKQPGSPSAARASLPDSADLLAWYDRHRRRLPWRALPGEAADPYRVWLSEIMLQQTTVKTVSPYYARFLARWPSVESLAAAPLEEVLKTWAGLGYYARARNLHACARAIVEQHGGKFPSEEAVLRTLPGIGTYTSAAVAAIAFYQPTVPVDGNVERVVARLFAVREPLPVGKPALQRLAQSLLPETRAGDFAQALMDLGATICTPVKPACALCPWMSSCVARARGEQETYPNKTAKQTGKLRRGAAFVAVRQDGSVLVRTRPTKGLLGGMTEVPTSEWRHDFDDESALEAAPQTGKQANEIRWQRIPGTVGHVFTHFPLQLVVYRADWPPKSLSPQGTRWVAAGDIADQAFPTVMRKVLAHALGSDVITPLQTPSASSRVSVRNSA